jgi:hypothetical protein
MWTDEAEPEPDMTIEEKHTALDLELAERCRGDKD